MYHSTLRLPLRLFIDPGNIEDCHLLNKDEKADSMFYWLRSIYKKKLNLKDLDFRGENKNKFI